MEMKHIISSILFCTLIATCLSDDIFVSNEYGNDKGSGSLESPFKTIQKAIVDGRRLKRRGAEFVTIHLRGGMYHVDRVINLFEQDSNTNITNYENEEVTITGSIKILFGMFNIHRQNEYIKVYKTIYDGKCSENTFFGNKRLVRARKPNLVTWTGENMSGEGPYLKMGGLLKSTPGQCTYKSKGRFRQECDDANKKGFVYKQGDMSDDWMPSIKTGRGVDVVVFHAWTAERATIDKINPRNNRVLFKKPLRKSIGSHPFSSGYRYIVENVESELDAPGEFYCKPINERQSELSFALSHYELNLFKHVYVGSNDKIFVVKKARNVAFNGIQFKYTDNKGFYGYSQTKAPLLFDSCSQISVTKCKFHHMGYNAIYTQRTKDINISNNDFKDIGYIGIAVDYNNQPNSQLATKNVLVANNTMSGCGVTNMFQPCCIHVRGARNIEVAWNSVTKISYAGIRVGWQKAFHTNYVESGEHVFNVHHNHVYNYGMEILNDFGGIYLSTNIADCKDKQDLSICNLHALIKNNVINTGRPYLYGGSGVYGDTASSALVVEENWLYNLSDAGVVFHCGQRNLAKSNVFTDVGPKRIFGTCNPVVSLPDGTMPEQQFTVDGNVFFVMYAATRMWKQFDSWTNQEPIFKNNLYYFENDDGEVSAEQRRDFFPKGRSYEEWSNNGERDEGSIYGLDPMFVDIEADDWRLHPESPMANTPVGRLNLRDVQEL